MHITAEKAKVYRVIDKNNDKVIGIFDDLDAIGPVLNKYTLFKYNEFFSVLLQENLKKTSINLNKIVGYEPDYNAPRNENGQVRLVPVYRKKNLYGIVVLDETGIIIDKSMISTRFYKKYSPSRYEESEKIKNKILSGLEYRKNNIYKIKKYYKSSSRSYGKHTDLHIFAHYFRKIRTANAIKQSMFVVKEDYEPVFRGKQRNLPTYRDDIMNSIHDNYKSWKHNSKRRKQWKEKSNAVISRNGNYSF